MESKDEVEIEGIQGELKKYCGLDTRGMVVLRRLHRLKHEGILCFPFLFACDKLPMFFNGRAFWSIIQED